jgi:hypothetical protein
MANSEHLTVLRQGVEEWNRWRQRLRASNPSAWSGLEYGIGGSVSQTLWRWEREEASQAYHTLLNEDARPNLCGADLGGCSLRGSNLLWTDLSRAKLNNADLREADLRMADLSDADLQEANLTETDLCMAHLNGADLRAAILSQADLRNADLSGADLQGANLSGADLRLANLSATNLSNAQLSNADLTQANLIKSVLVETDLTGATLKACKVYGLSSWDLRGYPKDQSDLLITPHQKAKITVDNLEIAQFLYLLLNNERIRNVIETIGTKAVLILGRFEEERKTVLDAIRIRLRDLGFVPMMFDFDRPAQRDFTETIMILAGMSRFIIADITNPKSSPLELQATMPNYMIPFVPIIHESEKPFAMFKDLKEKYGEWVLDVLKYDSTDNLLAVFNDAVVRPALEKAEILRLKKHEDIHFRHVRDYVK